jgi:hypothetical protein
VPRRERRCARDGRQQGLQVEALGDVSELLATEQKAVAGSEPGSEEEGEALGLVLPEDRMIDQLARGREDRVERGSPHFELRASLLRLAQEVLQADRSLAGLLSRAGGRQVDRGAGTVASLDEDVDLVSPERVHARTTRPR